VPVHEPLLRVRHALFEPREASRGVLVRHVLGREFAVTLAEAAVVDREHREPERAQLLHPAQVSGEVPAHPVQVVHNRRIRIGVGPPPRVDLLRAGLVVDGDEQFLNGCRGAAVPSRVALDHAERQLALLFRERAAAGRHEGDGRAGERGTNENGA
jgi:hypothetical protein